MADVFNGFHHSPVEFLDEKFQCFLFDVIN